MGRKLTMSLSAEKDYQENGKGVSTSTPDPKIFKPKPWNAGTKYTNKLFIPLMAPGKWDMFQATPERVAKYAMNPNFKLHSQGNELYTFFLTLHTHPVENVLRPDGTRGWANVICPRELNNYLQKTLGTEPMFTNDRCRFCEESFKLWNVHNSRWEELGYNKKDFSNNKEGYKRIINSDPILKSTYEKINNGGLKIKERYVFNIFDLEAINNPPEGGAQFQVWPNAPKNIYESLINIAETGIEFYVADNPAGITPINLTKNTEACSDGDLRNTKYTVMHGRTEQYSPEWINYLDSLEALVDPSEYIVMLSYADADMCLSEDSENTPVNTAVQVPPQAPVSAPPQAPAQATYTAPVTASQPHQVPPVGQPMREPVQAPPKPPVAPPTASSVPGFDDDSGQGSVQSPVPQPPVAPPARTVVNPTPQVAGTDGPPIQVTGGDSGRKTW